MGQGNPSCSLPFRQSMEFEYEFIIRGPDSTPHLAGGDVIRLKVMGIFLQKMSNKGNKIVVFWLKLDHRDVGSLG
jgi:hypothetical protein